MKFGKKSIIMLDHKGQPIPKKQFRYLEKAVKSIIIRVLRDQQPRMLYDSVTGSDLCWVNHNNKNNVEMIIISPRRFANLMLEEA